MSRSLSDVAGDVVGLTKFVWMHPANRKSRYRSLLRAARFQFRGRILRKRTLAVIGTKSKMWVDLHRTGGSKALYANPPDFPEMLIWQKCLVAGDLFVDIGANVGSYTLLAGDLGARVIALEPAADTCALLRENVQLNGYQVEVIQAAAGSSHGTLSFTSGRDCVNQFDPAGDTTVDLVMLDDVIGSRTVKGMKIDVEGFEIEVLKGCGQTLREGRVGLIQLEWNEGSAAAVGTDRSPVAALLADFGYRLYRPDLSGTLVPLAGIPPYGPDVFAQRV